MGIGYDRHVFVCENERDPEHPRGCCAAKGGAEIRAWFKEAIQARRRAGLPAGSPKVRAQRAGCLDYCEFGPLCVVYPEGVWYRPTSRGDVEEIVERHLFGGTIVERLLVQAQLEPGSTESGGGS